ncbi:hypothetical protein ACFPRL_04530 [Pseudoclavibacter helvolus]
MSPKPPLALAPKCTRCQSPGTPSTAEYWHMGESQSRLSIVSPRAVNGVKSVASLTRRAPFRLRTAVRPQGRGRGARPTLAGRGCRGAS